MLVDSAQVSSHKWSNSGKTPVESGPTLAKVGTNLADAKPMLVPSGQMLAEICHSKLVDPRPHLAEVVRVRLNSVEHGLKLAGSGRRWPMLVEVVPKLDTLGPKSRELGGLRLQIGQMGKKSACIPRPGTTLIPERCLSSVASGQIWPGVDKKSGRVRSQWA